MEIQNIDLDFIDPNFKCKIIYKNKDGKLSELFEVVSSTLIIFINLNSNMIINNKLKTISFLLYVFL